MILRLDAAGFFVDNAAASVPFRQISDNPRQSLSFEMIAMRERLFSG